jgi:hypothetical protein
MRRLVLRAALAFALAGIGWTAGRAQGDRPDFEISIDASRERTTVTCVGCDLTWIERSIPERPQVPSPTFSWGCGGPGATPCPSGRIGGYIHR